MCLTSNRQEVSLPIMHIIHKMVTASSDSASPPRPDIADGDRVAVPDGRVGTVVGSKVTESPGHKTPRGYRVWLDGTDRDGPHPWFLGSMLTPLLTDPPAAQGRPSA